MNDDRLSALLKAARPAADLRPGFEQNVWQRIEKAEQAGPAPGVLSWLAQWLLIPRIAAAGLAAIVLLAGSAGVVRGLHAGKVEARERYLASVDPAHSEH